MKHIRKGFALDQVIMVLASIIVIVILWQILMRLLA